MKKAAPVMVVTVRTAAPVMIANRLLMGLAPAVSAFGPAGPAKGSWKNREGQIAIWRRSEAGRKQVAHALAEWPGRPNAASEPAAGLGDSLTGAWLGSHRSVLPQRHQAS